MSVGVVRNVDSLGRLVVPKETREFLGIDNHDHLEIFTEDDKIMLRRYSAPGSCVFCHNMCNEDDKKIHGKQVCRECIEEFKNSI